MYTGYMYPFYRSPFIGYPGFVPGYGYGSFNGINAIGSAISNQSLVNTGNAFGLTQISTPTVIW